MLGFTFKLAGGWKGWAVFLGLAALCIALLVLAYVYLSKNDKLIGIGMLIAGVATAAVLAYSHAVPIIANDVRPNAVKYDDLVNVEEEQGGEEEEQEQEELSMIDESDAQPFINNQTDQATNQDEEETHVVLNKRDFSGVVRDIAQAESEALRKLE